MNSSTDILYEEAVDVLSALIRIPSFSREEKETADLLEQWLLKKGIETKRIGHNIVALNKHFDSAKPTVLLNSHHDTVKPNSGYTKDPFHPEVCDGKLFGLGSNDAGGCLVSLLMAFVHFYHRTDLACNLVFLASAEEEISGVNGVELVIGQLPEIAFAIVGEPTLLQLAVAERGLLVLDCVATGKAGHAARDEGENALYTAMNDIDWFRTYSFEKVSPFLGPVKMTVTSIETENKTHNIVPAQCRFIVDIRVNELYTAEEVLATIREKIRSEAVPRSTRLKSTVISQEHPVVKAGISLGKHCYGSPTTSDKALMPFPALKVGPGDSARSHTANEFIYLDEIKQGIQFYINLLNSVIL